MKTKPECLNLLGVMRRFRAKAALRAAEFAAQFPWRGFLIQAPQVTADLWGVGLQLGGVMGLIGEAAYGAGRAVFGQDVVVRGPPPSDPLGKAWSAMGGGSPQYTGGQFLSYEDHWLMLAGHSVASQLIMDNVSVSAFAANINAELDRPVHYFEPWKPSTVEFLRSVGWRPGGPYHHGYAGLPPVVTYRQLMEHEATLFPRFLEEARVDFPASASATWFQYVAADLCERLLTWGTGSELLGKDVFEPKELTFARLFEYGIFPPDGMGDDGIDYMLQRSLEIAAALGRSLPARSDMVSAAVEVWGEFKEQ